MKNIKELNGKGYKNNYITTIRLSFINGRRMEQSQASQDGFRWLSDSFERFHTVNNIGLAVKSFTFKMERKTLPKREPRQNLKKGETALCD